MLAPLYRAAFTLYIGIGYLATPDYLARGFGLPVWPHGDAAAFRNVKGVRDTVSGLLVLALLATRQRYALVALDGVLFLRERR